MKTYFITLFFLFLLLFTVNGRQNCTIIPNNLTCEYLSNPTGLDIRQPRFSWKLEAANCNDFGQRQTAYRILVSNSKRQIHQDIGDCWDSGWINSDDMQLIRYEGKPLQSDKDYFWKVTVKDEKGNISATSETATFSTGLFNQSEWTAKWIGTSEVYDPTKGSNEMYDPWFRKNFELKQKPEKSDLVCGFGRIS
jgi:alpha-L-rhamnosidase